MNDEFDIIQHTSPLREVILTPDEQARMRGALHALAQSNPPYSRWALWVRSAPVWAVALLMCVAGSTVALARDAQPGSVLYPVRVELNERVATALAGDEDAQDATELRHIAQALDEELAVSMRMEEEFLVEFSASSEALEDTHDISSAATRDALHEFNTLELELRALDRTFEEERDSGETMLYE